MNNVTYRKATIDDAYGIEYVAAHSWKETYYDYMPHDYLDNRVANISNNIDKTRDYLAKKNNYYVAEIDNKIVGIMNYSKEHIVNYGHLDAIYVLKDYHKLGIGKELFKIALNGILELGLNRMYLECVHGNPASGFYEKYGGKLVETMDYPIKDFSVKADIYLFKDIKSILIELENEKDINKKNKYKYSI